MRRTVLLICAVSLIAQPAWGWQRIVCRDGSPCAPATASATAADPCCVPAPCDAQPAAPVAPCTVSEPVRTDAVPPAPAGGEIHEPVFLTIATIPSDPPALKAAHVTHRDDARPAASSVPRQIHAARAPPRGA